MCNLDRVDWIKKIPPKQTNQTICTHKHVVLYPIIIFSVHWRTQAFFMICSTWGVIDLTILSWPMLSWILGFPFLDWLPYQCSRVQSASLFTYSFGENRWIQIFPKSINTKWMQAASSRIWNLIPNSIFINDNSYTDVYDHIQNWFICRVFIKGQGDWGSIQGWVIPKTQNMLHLNVVAIEKGAFGMPLTTVANNALNFYLYT